MEVRLHVRQDLVWDGLRQMLDYSGGSSLHDYFRALHCKRPPGPGTSLRTTPLRDPVLTATNGTRGCLERQGL
jgi:hypothetical protein